MIKADKLAIIGLNMAALQGESSAVLHRMVYDGIEAGPAHAMDAAGVDRLVHAVAADMKTFNQEEGFSRSALVMMPGLPLPESASTFREMALESTGNGALGRAELMLSEEDLSCVFLVSAGYGVVLKRESRAREDGDRVYSLIEGVSGDLKLSGDLGHVGYLDISGDGAGNFFSGDYRDLRAEFEKSCSSSDCACGFSGDFLESLLKASLSLYHRFIPAFPAFSGEDIDGELWKETPFYLPSASRTWFVGESSPVRRALVSVRGGFSLLLSEDSSATRRVGRYVGSTPPFMFLICEASQKKLKLKLEEFSKEISRVSDMELKCRAGELLGEYSVAGEEFTAVIVAGTGEAAGREAGVIARALNHSFVKKQEIRTPGGSYFTPEPLGPDGKVVFVYPGVGSAYTGLGQDLFTMYPGVLDFFGALVPDVGKHIMERDFYPRVSGKLSGEDLKSLDRDLRKNIMRISQCGMSWSVIYTMILSGYYGLFPDCAMGYSMGEASMMASMMVWKNPAELGVRMKGSDLFSRALSGELSAVREDWNLPAFAGDSNGMIWESYTLIADRSEVEKLVDSEDRVYITLINTDSEVVIAGEPEACVRIAEKLGCKYFPLRLDLAIHSGPAYRVYDRLVDLYNLELGEKSPVKFYSSSCYLPVPIRSRSVAHSIAKAFCDTVDFPRLVNKVYDDGGRIFIEVGPRQVCTQWISENLKGREHLAVPLDLKGTRNKAAIARALAQLVSHGVKLDLKCMFKF